MSFISYEKIRGYEVDGKMLCPDCAEKVNLDSIKETDIITEHRVEEGDEGYYFCDSCDKRL